MVPTLISLRKCYTNPEPEVLMKFRKVKGSQKGISTNNNEKQQQQGAIFGEHLYWSPWARVSSMPCKSHLDSNCRMTSLASSYPTSNSYSKTPSFIRPLYFKYNKHNNIIQCSGRFCLLQELHTFDTCLGWRPPQLATIYGRRFHLIRADWVVCVMGVCVKCKVRCSMTSCMYVSS